MSLKFVKIGLLVSLVALLADILAIALPWWSYREEEKFGELWKTNAGLWEECARITNIFGETKYNCFKIQEPSENINLARNTCLFGMLLILGGMLITCTGRWILVELHLVPLVGALATSFAGFLIWLGVLLYSEDYMETAGHEPWEMHAGWWVGLASSFLCFITAILYLWDKRKDSHVDGSEPQQSSSNQNQNSSSSYCRKDSWASGYAVGPQRRQSSRDSLDRQRFDTPIQSISRLEIKTSRYY